MCGIVGIVGMDLSTERANAIVAGMADRIFHRGPDGGGVVSHPDATLGMRRLAIVDVEHGQQPMASDDGTIVIVYNGEVYNAPALRARLEREGVRFRTRSDTEVVLRLYERDPDHVEEQLVGMWAFAIHDRKRRRLTLSRDRFGIKPLFYAHAGNALAFGSELRAFDRSLAPFASCFAIDDDAAHAMLCWNFVPDTSTIYRGVKRLSPATRLELDLQTKSVKTRTYWQLIPSAEAATISTLDDACDVTESLLRRAVREHLESDVPIATFLSGGIDSSLITQYAAEESTKPIKAYAIGFHEQRFDESPYARATAEKLGVDIEVRMFDESTGQRQLADTLLAYDEPLGDSSSIAAFMLAKTVAEQYKVALGGDGGDEVFAGYKKYMVVKLRRPFASMPKLRDRVGWLLGRLPSRNDRTHGWTELLRTARRLSRGLTGDDARVYAALTQWISYEQSAPLLRRPTNSNEPLDRIRRRFAESAGTPLQRTLASDMANTLCNDMLVKVDRATMANRLEARVPMLDHRVVEHGVGLPEKFTIGRNGKRVLRELHRRRFGSELANRTKMGFGVPVERWLRGRLDGACERLFDKKRLDRTGVLSSDALSGGNFRAWAQSDPIILWHAFALAAWLEVNEGGGPDSLRDILRLEQ